MRPVSFQRGYQMHPAGSCLVCFGNTKVVVSASIEDSVPPFLKGKGSGWVTADYAMLPGSTAPRKQREGLKVDGRSTEIKRLIGRALRAAVDVKKIGEVQITIDCDVLQADGGTRTAAISGGFVALVDALAALAAKRGKGEDHRSWMLGQVAAVSVGVVDGVVHCDLDYAKDSKADVDMNVVMRDRSLVEVQGTGEQGVFDRAVLGKLLDSAEAGIATIMAAQRSALGW